MKEYFDFSLTHKQKVRDFANKITPPNWCVYLIEEFDAMAYESTGSKLFIQLRIMDIFDKPPIDGKSLDGFVENRMSYYLMNAKVKIFLHPPPITLLEMKNLLVHELAHVVEMRWKGFRKKVYRGHGFITIEKKDITNQDLSINKLIKMRHKIKSFLKADDLMKKRAKKVKAAKIGWAKFFNDILN